MKKGNIQRYPWIASWHRPITLMHNIILDKYPIPSSFFSQAPQLGQHECIPAHSPIRESRPYFITTSSLAHTSTSIQKELPLLEASKHKNLVHNKWVVSKQGCDLVHLLSFNNDKRSSSIAKRITKVFFMQFLFQFIFRNHSLNLCQRFSHLQTESSINK